MDEKKTIIIVVGIIIVIIIILLILFGVWYFFIRSHTSTSGSLLSTFSSLLEGSKRIFILRKSSSNFMDSADITTFLTSASTGNNAFVSDDGKYALHITENGNLMVLEKSDDITDLTSNIWKIKKVYTDFINVAPPNSTSYDNETPFTVELEIDANITATTNAEILVRANKASTLTMFFVSRPTMAMGVATNNYHASFINGQLTVVIYTGSVYSSGVIVDGSQMDITSFIRSP